MNVTANQCYRAARPGHYLVTGRGIAVARFSNLYDAMDEGERRWLNSGGDCDLTITTIPDVSPAVAATDA